MDSDYYATVYAWFERCGIISNVRTHLRQNLVNALKSKDMTLNKANIAPKSAKQYVYDLLIAEYLWNHHYTYSLSVFASEAPLLINFRQFVSQPNDSSSDANKLQTDYVWHTLETLGIKPDDPGGQTIMTDYANNDVPLLLSLLKYVSHLQGKHEVENHKDTTSTSNCATQTDVYVFNYSEEKRKIITAKKKLIQQHKVYDNQLREKEEQLQIRTSTIDQQLIVLNEKLTEAQGLMEAVDAKERRLAERIREDERHIYKRKLELSVKETSLLREAERLEKERDSYRMFESNLKKLQEELVKIQQDLPKNEATKVTTHQASTQTDVEDTILGNKKFTDVEKRELESLVKAQQARIEELTLKVVRLTRQLEEAQLIKWTSVENQKTLLQSAKTTIVLSESSSTDEIIQDAKQRLKRLEEESLKADQSYFNCVATSLQLL